MRIVIVGAGLAGCSVAWHLAKHARVLLLEQGSGPGEEASAQNAGMVRRMGEDPIERALAIRTHAWMENPGEDWEESPPSRKVGAFLGLAEDTDALTDAAAHLRARGLRVQACDRPAEVAPILRGAPVGFGWWLPEERVADAHSLLAGFLRGARRHGAELRCGVQVQGAQVEGGRVVGVRTAEGLVGADAVVLACGAWGGAFARALGLERPLLPVRRTLLRSAPHPLATPDHPWTWIDDAGLYARPEGGGWLISPCDEAIDPPSPGPGSAASPTELHRALAADKLRRWMPAMGEPSLQQGWSGLRTFAPDRRPVLGEDPELSGLWWAAGLGGFGVSGCYAVGEALAAWLRGEETPWLHRASVLPGRPLPTRWLIRPDGELFRARLVSGR